MKTQCLVKFIEAPKSSGKYFTIKEANAGSLIMQPQTGKKRGNFKQKADFVFQTFRKHLLFKTYTCDELHSTVEVGIFTQKLQIHSQPA